MGDARMPGILELTPLNPAFNDDPHALLDPLRSQCPVHRDAMAGVFILSKHADVRGTLSDTSMLRSPENAEEAAVMTRRGINREPPPGLEIAPDQPRHSILTMDEPEHMRVREPLAKALYKRVAKSRALVQLVVDGWLDRIGGAKTFDVMDTFAVRVPIDVIARILGVDETRLTEFRAWSEGAILGLHPMPTPEQVERIIACNNALNRYMRGLMAERAAAPRDDLTSDMMALKADGANLTEGEICTNLLALLIGGNLTTTDLIGNAIWLLLTHPEQLAKLKAEPGLINSCVEEVLRYESPVDITGRIAPRDMQVSGCPIHDRASMIMELRAANRDPAAFPEPHRFDIARKDAPHVAFGGGTHLCIGAPLARLEAQVAIPAFFARYPNAQLADPAMKPEWRDLPFFRGLKKLVVAV
ncbi:MAG: cytochrome P450 [Alphaproteobacteria bacterium]|nr:cytochrome P450 [Alphaproteobacteria bacterium]MBL7097590.1 cytochrome P450 [Alphaproteobacteria bacterium]